MMLKWNTPATPQKKRKTQKVTTSGEKADAVMTLANRKLLSVNDNLLPILSPKVDRKLLIREPTVLCTSRLIAVLHIGQVSQQDTSEKHSEHVGGAGQRLLPFVLASQIELGQHNQL